MRVYATRDCFLTNPSIHFFSNPYHSTYPLSIPLTYPVHKPRKHLYFQQKKDTRQAFVLPALYPFLWIVFFANLVNSVRYKVTIDTIRTPSTANYREHIC